MPLHFPNPGKSSNSKTQHQWEGNGNVAAVNKTTTFGLGPGQWRVRDDLHSAFILKNLADLRRTGEFTDITFTYDGESIMANRVVLAAVSPVMRNVFTKRESLMNAEILPPEALHQLVRFIYSSSAEVDYDIIKKIEKASRVLQIHAITKMCSNVLATIPISTVESSRTKRITRQNAVVQSHTSTPPPPARRPSMHVGEDKSNRSDSNNDMASEMSDILMSGIKKDNRSSIKLSFHSRSGTPLNRSTDDLPQISGADTSSCGSAEKAETTSIENDDQKTNDNCLPKINIHPPMDGSPVRKTELNLEQKRNRYRLSKSLDDGLVTDKKSETGILKSKSAIPLSRLLVGSHSSVSNTDIQSASNERVSKGSLSNGTWPKSVRTSPSRKNIPPQWRKTTGPAISTELDPISNEQPVFEIGAKSMKLTEPARDVFTIGFKSKSMPNLMKGLHSLREQNQFCDLTLVVGNAKIQCHKVVLAASSEVFRAILRKISSRDIVLTKIDEAAIQEMIKFIYTGQCNIDKDNVMGVMRGCRRFRLHFVAKQCASYLDRNVSSFNSFFSPDNVLVAYKIAGEYGFPKLREESKKFAISHFWEVAPTPCFKDLTSIELNSLVSNEPLRIARTRDPELELQLFSALVGWLTCPSKQRTPRMTERVMKFINFSNLRPGYLHRVVSMETAIMQDAATRERILEVLRNNNINIATCKRSQSMQLPSSPMLSTKESSAPSQVHAVVSEGGSGGKKLINNIYSFVQSDKRAKHVTSSPLLWSSHAVTSFKGSLYLAGGRDHKKSKRICSDVYKYDENGWNQLPNMKVARSHFALLPLDGAIYAIGGLSENIDKQYLAVTSCEKLELDYNRGNLKWKLIPLSLPYPSYSHAGAAASIKLASNAATNVATNKDTTKRKPPSSPVRKRGFRFSTTFGESKSPTMVRGSPRQTSLRYGKTASNLNQTDNVMNEVIFICGGKSNPRQNLMSDPFDKSKFIEKRQLPVPCTQLSMTSSNSSVFFVCDDVVETSQFRMFDYSIGNDQWTEIKLPLMTERISSFENLETATKNNKKPLPSSISCTASQGELWVAMSAYNSIETHSYNLTTLKWTSKNKMQFSSPVYDFLIYTK